MDNSIKKVFRIWNELQINSLFSLFLKWIFRILYSLGSPTFHHFSVQQAFFSFCTRASPPPPPPKHIHTKFCKNSFQHQTKIKKRKKNSFKICRLRNPIHSLSKSFFFSVLQGNERKSFFFLLFLFSFREKINLKRTSEKQNSRQRTKKKNKNLVFNGL